MPAVLHKIKWQTLERNVFLQLFMTFLKLKYLQWGCNLLQMINKNIWGKEFLLVNNGTRLEAHARATTFWWGKSGGEISGKNESFFNWIIGLSAALPEHRSKCRTSLSIHNKSWSLSVFFRSIKCSRDEFKIGLHTSRAGLIFYNSFTAGLLRIGILLQIFWK